MGEQDDKIFRYEETSDLVNPEGSITNAYIQKLTIRWDVLLSIVAERGIQALALGAVLVGAITYAQNKGGLC